MANALESSDGMARGRGLVLKTLTRLKQICNHPSQLHQATVAIARSPAEKFGRTAEICEDWSDRNGSVYRSAES